MNGSNQETSCRVCGCTDDNCTDCYQSTGVPCHWMEPDLCSACAGNQDQYRLSPRGLYVPAG